MDCRVFLWLFWQEVYFKQLAAIIEEAVGRRSQSAVGRDAECGDVEMIETQTQNGSCSTTTESCNLTEDRNGKSSDTDNDAVGLLWPSTMGPLGPYSNQVGYSVVSVNPVQILFWLDPKMLNPVGSRSSHVQSLWIWSICRSSQSLEPVWLDLSILDLVHDCLLPVLNLSKLHCFVNLSVCLSAFKQSGLKNYFIISQIIDVKNINLQIKNIKNMFFSLL